VTLFVGQAARQIENAGAKLLASPSRQLLRRRSSALGQDRRCCRAGARALPPRNQSPWASWVFGLAQRAACIRQELALRARDRPRCGHPGSARSVWHQFGINRWLAPWTAVPGPRGGFVPDDQRDEARACSGGWLARAWPLQRASLRRNRARRPRFYHGGIRRAHLSDTTIHALCSSVSWPALPSCRRTSLRRRYRFASRNDAHTPHARPFWQLQVMFGCAIIMPLLPFGRFPTLSVLASPCMARSCA
jgi:hypothetical protein